MDSAGSGPDTPQDLSLRAGDDLQVHAVAVPTANPAVNRPARTVPMANHQDLVTAYHQTGSEAGGDSSVKEDYVALRTIGFTGPSSPTRKARGRIPSHLRQR